MKTLREQLIERLTISDQPFSIVVKDKNPYLAKWPKQIDFEAFDSSWFIRSSDKQAEFLYDRHTDTDIHFISFLAGFEINVSIPFSHLLEVKP
ncbi:hypothetical protein [Spirosoma litoris]